MDYSREIGSAALGARLRRASEAIDRDATRVYAAMGITFEQRWFGVLNQLALNGPMTVSELADALRIARASVSQTRQSLEDAGLIVSKAHPSDARQRYLAIGAKGAKLVDRLASLWQAMDEASRELDHESGHAVAALDRLDNALARKSMFDRIAEKMHGIDAAAPARKKVRRA